MPTYGGTNQFSAARRGQIFRPQPWQQDEAFNAYIQAFREAGRVIPAAATGSRNPYEVMPGFGDPASYDRAKRFWLGTPEGQTSAAGPRVSVVGRGGSTPIAQKAAEAAANPWLRGTRTSPSGAPILTRQRMSDVASGIEQSNRLGAAVRDDKKRVINARIDAIAMRVKNQDARLAIQIAKQEGDENKAVQIARLGQAMDAEKDPAVKARIGNALRMIQQGADYATAVSSIKAQAGEAERLITEQRGYQDRVRGERDATVDRRRLEDQKTRERLLRAQQDFESAMFSARTTEARQSAARRYINTLNERSRVIDQQILAYDSRRGTINGQKPPLENDPVVIGLRALQREIAGEIIDANARGVEPVGMVESTAPTRPIDEATARRYLDQYGDPERARQAAKNDGYTWGS